jgi:hypothetical protein
VVLVEGGLQGTEAFAVVGGQTFDGGHLGLDGLGGQQRAGLGGASVEQDRAGAAGGGVAADLGAGQAEVVAKELNQQGAGLEGHRHGRAVDLHRQADLLIH